MCSIPTLTWDTEPHEPKPSTSTPVGSCTGSRHIKDTSQATCCSQWHQRLHQDFRQGQTPHQLQLLYSVQAHSLLIMTTAPTDSPWLTTADCGMWLDWQLGLGSGPDSSGRRWLRSLTVPCHGLGIIAACRAVAASCPAPAPSSGAPALWGSYTPLCPGAL